MANPKPVHSFKKGNEGRPKGATNLLTRTVKDAVLMAFNELQNDPKANLIEWGRKNPGLFYPIAAKLIPTEVNANLNQKIIEVKDPDEFIPFEEVK